MRSAGGLTTGSGMVKISESIFAPLAFLNFFLQLIRLRAGDNRCGLQTHQTAQLGYVRFERSNSFAHWLEPSVAAVLNLAEFLIWFELSVESFVESVRGFDLCFEGLDSRLENRVLFPQRLFGRFVQAKLGHEFPHIFENVLCCIR